MPARKNTVAKEVRSIAGAFRQLAQAFEQLAPALAVTASAATPTMAPTKRRRLTITPQRRAALKLQGKYVGHMRGLKPRQKAQVKKIRAAKGIRAAIAAARRLAS